MQVASLQRGVGLLNAGAALQGAGVALVRRRVVAARGRGGGKGGERERENGGELREVHIETGYLGLNGCVRVRKSDGICVSLLYDSAPSGKYFCYSF